MAKLYTFKASRGYPDEGPYISGRPEYLRWSDTPGLFSTKEAFWMYQRFCLPGKSDRGWIMEPADE